MITFGFLLKLVTVPFATAKIIIQYFTVGTIYSRTHHEFRGSLWKNLHLGIIYHLSGNLQKTDVNTFVARPITNLFKKYESSPLVKGFRNFGKQNDEHSYWVTEAEDKEDGTKGDLVIYMHGGGYILSIFETQFLAFLVLYYALDEDKRKKTSFLLVDYSLTCKNHTYPTQIWETIHAYEAVVKQGYQNIHIVGDSAGAHLALSIARYIAYPEESKAHFLNFPQFDFNFGPLPQPKTLILLSVWPRPCVAPNVPSKHGVETYGDLGSTDTLMGDYYVGDLDLDFINDYFSFSDTNFDQHWAKVEPITSGDTLVITGEREVLRDHVDDFLEAVNKHGTVTSLVEKGGIHAGLVYVEALDYMGPTGAAKALRGDFKDKFSFNEIAKFLNPRIQ